MNRCINKIILVGTVGRDPDVQTTETGNKIAHVSLATTRTFPRVAEREDEGRDGIVMDQRTEWHRLTLYGRLALLAEEFVRKGDRLYVEGRMEYDSFEKNGVTIPTAEICVRELVMLNGTQIPGPPCEKEEEAVTPTR